jgi:hypothetical protein
MYSLNKIKTGVKHPQLIVRERNRLYHTRLHTRPYNENGIDIFEEDWDNLLILDACRFDMFADVDLPGELQRVTSRGSNTPEFLDGNFDGHDLSDTVYVTANPMFYRNDIDTTLHEVVNVWDGDGWNEDIGTVPPEEVTEAALEAIEAYENKRIVVHYIQPHYPFISSDTDFDKGHMSNPDERQNLWVQMLTNQLEYSDQEVWEMYQANLNIIVPYVRQIMDEVTGRTVVTSDHGNMVGERSFPIPIREYGHPRSLYTNELVQVPWLVHDSGPRREIVAEDSVQSASKATSNVVKDRLGDLGYK